MTPNYRTENREPSPALPPRENTPARSSEEVLLLPVAGEVKAIQPLTPSNNQKNPLAALSAGLFLGPIGIGLYLKSWRAFFIGLGVFVFLLVVLAPTGPGEIMDVPMDLLFSGLYAAYRVASSNSGQKGEGQ